MVQTASMGSLMDNHISATEASSGAAPGYAHATKFDTALSGIMGVFEERGLSNEEIICNLGGLKDEIETLIDSLRA